jgi:polyhydroxybutyrate depolymerase
MPTLRALAVLVLAACGTSSPKPKPPTTFGGDRPTDLQVPPMLVHGQQYPLVLILHGYGANGFLQQAYFGMNDLAKQGLAFVLAPDGLTDSTGSEFWNADPACCDYDHKNPDDVGYLGGLIDDVSAAWPIDPQRVYVIGHSNGGYMAYRLACDRSDVVTNIVVLAGAAASDPSTCTPHRPVSVLHMHGTADAEVPYTPAAESSVAQWAQHDGCAATRTAGASLDLDTSLPGAETTTGTYDGCPVGITVELWTIQGAMHVPALDQRSFGTLILQYLEAHQRQLLPD